MVGFEWWGCAAAFEAQSMGYGAGETDGAKLQSVQETPGASSSTTADLRTSGAARCSFTLSSVTSSA